MGAVEGGPPRKEATPPSMNSSPPAPRSPAPRSSSQEPKFQDVVWRRLLHDDQPPPFTQVAMNESPRFLGEGGTAAVHQLYTNNQNIGDVAQKVYYSDINVEDEIDGYRRAGQHKGILSVYGLAEAFAPNGEVKPALFTKRMDTNGEKLFLALDRMRESGRITSSDFDEAIRLVMRRTAKVILHFKRMKMTMGDIKPNNILAIADNKARTVVSDFERWSADNFFNRGGPEEYQPPELHSKDQWGFEPKYDIYSLGAMLEAVAGEGPLEIRNVWDRVMDDDPKQRFTREQALACLPLAQQTGETQSRIVGMLDRAFEMRDFLDGAIHHNPDQRFTPEQALAHRYLKKQTPEIKDRAIKTLLDAMDLTKSQRYKYDCESSSGEEP